MLSIRNSAADEILGNFTCKIASGEWSDFLSLGLINKPDDALVELANTFRSCGCGGRTRTYDLRVMRH